MRNALLGCGAFHAGLRHLDVGARAQQVGRKDRHAQRLRAGQRRCRIGLQPLRIGPCAAQQCGQHVGAAGLGFTQARTQSSALAGLQLQLAHGLSRAQALLLAHLGQLQGTRIQLRLLVDQGQLALGHADVQVAVHHVGHQATRAACRRPRASSTAAAALRSPASRARTGPGPSSRRCWRGNTSRWLRCPAACAHRP
ncbi:hypothetical protein GY14_02010 [Delftia tsuruhatensis]|nr:hypothetical protein GY14_02010 [Delftia tsuruhatensis]